MDKLDYFKVKNFCLFKHNKNNVKSNLKCKKTFVMYIYPQQKAHIHNR